MQKKIFEKCLFAYEIRFAVEKKTKIVWELYDKHFFFQKNENLSFLSPDCFRRIKHPQK